MQEVLKHISTAVMIGSIIDLHKAGYNYECNDGVVSKVTHWASLPKSQR